MMVDIAAQKSLKDIFAKNLNHHRINSMTSNNQVSRNNQISADDDLGRRAQLILGSAAEQVDYNHQTSFELNIPQVKKQIHVSPKQALFEPINIKKERNQITNEQLIPLIMKLVTLSPMTKFPAISVRSSTKTIESDENSVKSNDNENDSYDDDENEKNNDKEEDDDEDDDIDSESVRNKSANDFFSHDSNQTASVPMMSADGMLTESDPTNDENDTPDPNQFSLSDFLEQKDEPSEIENKVSPLNPAETIVSTISRREELIRSFSTSISTSIDLKQPSLPIQIPKHLFLDQSTSNDNKPHRTKRHVDEHEQTSSSNNSNTTKRSKISHLTENFNGKSENQRSTPMKTENLSSIKNEATTKTSISLSSTATTVGSTQGKPMASVKPLLQSMSNDNSQITNSNANSENNGDRLTANNTVPVNPNRRTYMNTLNNSTIKDLNSIAKRKKREADGIRRQTIDEIRQSMSLYLESVCYFIQCAHFEPALDQRAMLLSATLAMLDHLAQNHLKMFQLSNSTLLPNLRQKFLLINYWLQSLLFKLRYQNDWSSAERWANQVNEHFNQPKSSPSSQTSDKNNQIFYEFSKFMIASFQSDSLWNKADRLSKESSLKDFLEQLTKQNQNRRLSRDDQMSDFILYIFDAIDLLRSTVA